MMVLNFGSILNLFGLFFKILLGFNFRLNELIFGVGILVVGVFWIFSKWLMYSKGWELYYVYYKIDKGKEIGKWKISKKEYF